MKHMRLLNWTIGVAFALALIVWLLGLYRQHTRREFGGWPVYAFIFCWGFLALAMSGRAILKGEIGSTPGGCINRQQNPIKFWIGVGIFCIAGSVAMVIGAFKLIKHLKVL
jgi:hypothetical protein